MSLLKARDAAAFPAALPCIDDLVAIERPVEPLQCLRPAVIEADAHAFVDGFPGTTLYAVKCNPEPVALCALWAGGVRHFDCASAGEVALVRSLLPEAVIHFMHPVKSRHAIAEAWSRHGVRDFVLDSEDELAKILEATSREDRGLIVRLAMPPGLARYDLSGKFGASIEEAADLLRAARPHASRLGVSFHVGSQCLDPLAWRRALDAVHLVLTLARVPVEIIDVGGGFPVAYADVTPPPLGAFFAEIEEGFERLGLPDGVELWAEPGRALVAAGASLVLQVLLRRGDALFVNDGIYGSLSDAGRPGFRFPSRLIRPGAVAEATTGFTLFGPTCDSADAMAGPFVLPADVGMDDWIEIGQLGAYGASLRTAFNGFDAPRLVEVRDGKMI